MRDSASTQGHQREKNTGLWLGLLVPTEASAARTQLRVFTAMCFLPLLFLSCPNNVPNFHVPSRFHLLLKTVEFEPKKKIEKVYFIKSAI